jgi:hypothetical protein
LKFQAGCEALLPMRAEDRRTISCRRLAVALPHSAISPSVRPQPVQTLALRSISQIFFRATAGAGSSAATSVKIVLRYQQFTALIVFSGE